MTCGALPTPGRALTTGGAADGGGGRVLTGGAALVGTTAKSDAWTGAATAKSSIISPIALLACISLSSHLPGPAAAGPTKQARTDTKGSSAFFAEPVHPELAE